MSQFTFPSPTLSTLFQFLIPPLRKKDIYKVNEHTTNPIGIPDFSIQIPSKEGNISSFFIDFLLYLCNIILIPFIHLSNQGGRMKVLLVNGSPHRNGCTYTALELVAKTLNNQGIETEIYQIPHTITPCLACYACREHKKCIIDDGVNEFIDKMETADGLIIGSPVHYAAASALVTTFLDRVFFAGASRGVFAHKPGTCIVSARRAGTTATLDQLNKYFTISQMPIISGRYWNMVHGSQPADVLQDKEGCQNMRILAKNFAWHLKCLECAKQSGITPPEPEVIEWTNFIR